MGDWNLEREYQLLVDEAIGNGEISIRRDAPDLRDAPRFPMRNEHVGVRVEPQFKLVDLSASGVAFLSELPFETGEVLHVVLKNAMAIQARVVTCPLIESDPQLLEARYRVQCRFDNAANGKHMLVLLKELQREGRSRAVN